MNIFHKFFNQTSKPQGILGRLMIDRMNRGHAELSNWGRAHLTSDTPKEVLDIGCGGGYNVGALLNKYPEANVTGIDYSDVSVRKAMLHNIGMINKHRCQILQGDVSDLMLPEGKYDLVTAFETIYFWPGLSECFAQVAKVLKSGGTFMIVNESDGTDETALNFEQIIEGMQTYTIKEIKAALKEAGFSDAKAYHHKSKPWIVVLATK